MFFMCMHKFSTGKPICIYNFNVSCYTLCNLKGRRISCMLCCHIRRCKNINIGGGMYGNALCGG